MLLKVNLPNQALSRRRCISLFIGGDVVIIIVVVVVVIVVVVIVVRSVGEVRVAFVQ